MATLGMSKEDMTKALANKTGVLDAGITASMIGERIHNKKITDYYRAIFQHGKADQIQVLVDHVRKNIEKGVTPNKRRQAVARQPKRPKNPGGSGQLRAIFVGVAASQFHRLWG